MRKKQLAKDIKRAETRVAAEARVAATAKPVKRGKAAADSDEEEEAEGVFSSLFRSMTNVGLVFYLRRIIHKDT